MHYNIKLCQGCKFHSSCMVYWGESCRMNGGTKIPRVEKMGNLFSAWERAEKDEEARQQAVRDQLRATAEANAVRTRPWAAGE